MKEKIKAEELLKKIISDPLFTGVKLEKALDDFREILDNFQPPDPIYKNKLQKYSLEDIDKHVSDEKCFEMVVKIIFNEISHGMWLDKEIVETVIKKAIRFWTSN